GGRHGTSWSAAWRVNLGGGVSPQGCGSAGRRISFNVRVPRAACPPVLAYTGGQAARGTRTKGRKRLLGGSCRRRGRTATDSGEKCAGRGGFGDTTPGSNRRGGWTRRRSTSCRGCRGGPPTGTRGPTARCSWSPAAGRC